MSLGKNTSGEVGKLFNRYFVANRTLDDISLVEAELPDDAAVLRGLAARCRQESIIAFRAGYHTEGRRFEILARQFNERAEKIDSRKA